MGTWPVPDQASRQLQFKVCTRPFVSCNEALADSFASREENWPCGLYPFGSVMIGAELRSTPPSRLHGSPAALAAQLFGRCRIGGRLRQPRLDDFERG